MRRLINIALGILSLLALLLISLLGLTLCLFVLINSLFPHPTPYGREWRTRHQPRGTNSHFF